MSKCHERQIWKNSQLGEIHWTWPAFANHQKIMAKSSETKTTPNQMKEHRNESRRKMKTTNKSNEKLINRLKEKFQQKCVQQNEIHGLSFHLWYLLYLCLCLCGFRNCCFVFFVRLFCARCVAHRNKLHILCAMRAIKKKKSCRGEWRKIAIFIMKLYDDFWLDNTFGCNGWVAK